MRGFQQRHKIVVLAVAAYHRPPASSRWLVESCRRQGIELTLLGQGQTYHSNYCKIGLVADYLAAHPEWDYVLAVDFRDVIFCGSLRELFSKYLSYGQEIVAGAERRSWPIPSHTAAVPRVGTSFAHFNSGTILATSRGWQQAWRWMQQRRAELGGVAPEIGAGGRTIFTSDQAAWSDLYISGEASLGLDYRCEMFQVLTTVDAELSTTNRDLLLEGRRVCNRETGGRACIVHANGSTPVEPWGRYVLEPPTVWNGRLIQRLRTAELATLQDVESLTQLLLDLGLHAVRSEAFDVDLLPYCDKGLAIWQQPVEFARYLVWLSTRPPIQSYLEIGVADGGSFITTVEYLRRFHPLRVAGGLDPVLSHQVHDYTLRHRDVHFVQGTSACAEAERFSAAVGRWDLILIDGEHTARAVRADWDFARRHGRYVAFHDIAPGRFDGLWQLWQHICATYAQTSDFTDYQQYAPLGLGIVDLGYGLQ